MPDSGGIVLKNQKLNYHQWDLFAINVQENVIQSIHIPSLFALGDGKAELYSTTYFKKNLLISLLDGGSIGNIVLEQYYSTLQSFSNASYALALPTPKFENNTNKNNRPYFLEEEKQDTTSGVGEIGKYLLLSVAFVFVLYKVIIHVIRKLHSVEKINDEQPYYQLLSNKPPLLMLKDAPSSGNLGHSPSRRNWIEYLKERKDSSDSVIYMLEDAPLLGPNRQNWIEYTKKIEKSSDSEPSEEGTEKFDPLKLLKEILQKIILRKYYDLLKEHTVALQDKLSISDNFEGISFHRIPSFSEKGYVKITSEPIQKRRSTSFPKNKHNSGEEQEGKFHSIEISQSEYERGFQSEYKRICQKIPKKQTKGCLPCCCFINKKRTTSLSSWNNVLSNLNVAHFQYLYLAEWAMDLRQTLDNKDARKDFLSFLQKQPNIPRISKEQY